MTTDQARTPRQPLWERPGYVLDLLHAVQDGTTSWADAKATLAKYHFAAQPEMPSVTSPDYLNAMDDFRPVDTTNSWAEFDAASRVGLLTRARYMEVYDAKQAAITPATAEAKALRSSDFKQCPRCGSGRVALSAVPPVCAKCGYHVEKTVPGSTTMSGIGGGRSPGMGAAQASALIAQLAAPAGP